MKKSLVLAIAGVLAAASFASAANREGQFSISPVIGGYSFLATQDAAHDVNPVFGGRAGYNFTKNLGIEGLFDYASLNNKGSVNVYRFGGELLYHFMPDNAFVPYVAAGINGMSFTGGNEDKRVRTAFDGGVGAKYFITDSFALRGDVRAIFYDRLNRMNTDLEYTIGAYIPFGGVKPAAKPVEPAPAPAPAPKVVEPPPAPAPAPKVVVPPPAPVPAPPAAPTAALTLAPATVVKGQSTTLNWKSKNATGCDIQPGIGPVPSQGARTVTPGADTSYSLSCSGAGGTATSAAAVAVTAPPAPAPKAEASPERFCSKPAVINVQFDTDKAAIKPRFESDLKNVAAFLTEYPKARGEISGHTDNVGSKAYNDKLSQARAESVKKYIVEKYGIAADRITAKGYGFSKPVADNKTKEGKAQNRRIEANFTCE